jgi:benzoylformate decarboxylase
MPVNHRAHAGEGREETVTTVRDATFEVLRRYDMTTLFSNPGSTEVPFLAGLPDDLRFVLALHEGSVVGMATGVAIARDRPQFVLLHTTAGLGNAVGALATARVNRAPLVVVVGQQDRRHLALEPFLAGQLDGLAGSYPVWVNQPVRAVDVPGAIARAWHEAMHGHGPALVVVPMDDWLMPYDADVTFAAPVQLHRAAGVDDATIGDLASLVAGGTSPVLVAGAGADTTGAWAAMVALAEHLNCPVWQEPFGGRAGFPQDHPFFAGHLPAGRSRLREVLDGHDLVVVVGTAAIRQYPFEPGPLLPAGARLAVVTDDPAQAHRSPADVAVIGPIAAVCERLVATVASRPGAPPAVANRPRPPAPPEGSGLLEAVDVLGALATRLAPDTVLIEEAPSARPNLHALLPARTNLGFLSAAMGGLGFALPAAAGVRMALPDRPVVAVVGDGSALYGIQALWSAARYGCGVLYVILANGRYSIMDRLAAAREEKPPWPPFDDVSISGLARSFGCAAQRVETYPELVDALDTALPGLRERTEPLVLDVRVAPDSTFRADQAPSL